VARGTTRAGGILTTLRMPSTLQLSEPGAVGSGSDRVRRSFVTFEKKNLFLTPDSRKRERWNSKRLRSLQHRILQKTDTERIEFSQICLTFLPSSTAYSISPVSTSPAAKTSMARFTRKGSRFGLLSYSVIFLINIMLL
jgi:hypothetical protein